MTVRELIEMLEGMDENAQVRCMVQPTYPFEHSLRGVAPRSDFSDMDEEDDEHTSEEDGKSNDVFLVVGEQLCYGTKRAWEAV